ncbi:Processive diacylglycerol beta-glucosyltransferase [Quillaja saponaria]|uniref:Processive diacylglycerol beta-glucosyltransferase n=1 Tax=Quillaja saponaria TaxID=32244 RepID=A0AAD7PVB6_QUISA|nr:Processive diacylglycerol beta-glucosyltransferase [Quillaja saponaria]
MPTEPVKLNQSSSAEGEKHRQLDREIKVMVSAITNRLTDFHKLGSTHKEDEDEHGVRIITLAGTNTGANLRSELDGKHVQSPNEVLLGDEDEPLSAYVNSNFQAINNSIMLGGNYNTNDPGVHLEIADFTEHKEDHKPEKHGKKGKEKEKDKEHSKN